MADIQIQDLPPATTPLGSSDVIPIVQSGITKSVTISSGEFVLADSPNVFTNSNTYSATGSSYRLRITSGAGNGKYVVYQTTGLTRWEIGSDSASETGANNGSDLVINRYDDAGNYLASPLTIERDNGLTTLEILTVPTINLGNTDTTITRSAAGVLAVEGGVIPKENRANTFTSEQTTTIDNAPGFKARSIATTAYTTVEAQASNYASGPSFTASLLQQYSSAAAGTTAGLSNASLGVLWFQNCGAGLVATNGSAPLVFGTVSTERMRIDASGNALIGYTTSNGPLYKLQVNSQIFATSATIATSDGSYKEDITPLDGALDLVSALNPVQFSWKEHPVHNFDRAQPTVGFIAQEVQQALADTPYLNSIVKANTCTIEREEFDEEGNVTKPAVTEEFLGIAEGNMIALLTKAIQELKAEFDTYKASHP